MANSKVQLADGSVLIDLTSDTVSPEVLKTGFTAHDASGNTITGTMDVSGWTTDGIANASEPNGKLVITGTTVKIGAFINCSGITEIDAPNLVEAHALAFYGCDAVEKCNFPNLTTVHKRAFNDFGKSGSLRSIFLPKLTTLNTTTEIPDFAGSLCLFASCNAQYVVLPAFNGGTSTYFLADCPNLLGVDLECNTINANCFNGAKSINVIVLRKTGSAGAKLSSTNAFNGSQFASEKAGGTLYVPQSLISWYQSATNWSTILGYANNQILPIEGSIYETAYVDGTPIK